MPAADNNTTSVIGPRRTIFDLSSICAHCRTFLLLSDEDDGKLGDRNHIISCEPEIWWLLFSARSSLVMKKYTITGSCWKLKSFFLLHQSLWWVQNYFISISACKYSTCTHPHIYIARYGTNVVRIPFLHPSHLISPFSWLGRKKRSERNV